MRAPAPHPVQRLILASTLVLATLSAAVGLQASPTRAATTWDGSSQARAAASCWEIKQDDDAASSGTYWLVTPRLQAPAQFYCDMDTDGGGWVLIGRGREGWTENYDGQGTPADVAGTVTGTAAFKPKQLSASTIDGLLGGGRVDALADPIRLRRSTDTSGTSWQESRFALRSRDRWSWALSAGHPITGYSFGDATTPGATTREFGRDSDLRRVMTYGTSANGWRVGFNFGSQARGTTASGSYIHAVSTTSPNPSPFSQLFIRPRLRTADQAYPALPSAGTAAQTMKAVAKSGALRGSWGVTGLGAGGTSENATETQAFAQIGNTMYVGGNFTTVQKGAAASGADKVAQPYLAAFDATTGDWISSFRPRLNSQVKALEALPGGKLAVGGEFTSVGGSSRTGLAVLDASTGALDPAWTSTVENRVGGGSKVSVRALDSDGTNLYVGGAFTHFVRGTSAVYARNGGRLKLTTGIADGGWNPEFNGTVASLDLSDDSMRAYFAGYFTTSKGATADRGAAISTSAGAARSAAWQPTFSTSGTARYQQAVREVGSKVWLAGSQHSMFGYDRGSLALENAHVTKQGGDLQALGDGDGVVYGGCHCEHWNYSDTTDYDNLGAGSTTTNWSQADKINFVGAWDASTGDYLPAFTPTSKARTSRGAWALKVGDDGTLWAGGTYTSIITESGSNQWAGGFVRFAQRPHDAPGAPSSLQVDVVGDVATLSWNGSISSGVTYEVLRGGRVVATTTARTVEVADASPGDRYVVRAHDGSGNRSASTPVVVADQSAESSSLIADGAEWSYYFDNAAPVAATWRDKSFDDAAWRRGSAPFGWGSASITTNIDVPEGTTRALASYYRKAFDVADPGAFSTLNLTSRADDGIVVYLNGAEVARSNMPSGLVTPMTYASTGRSTATVLAAPLEVELPATALLSGRNVVTVEVHSNYRATPSASMDLSLSAER